jgi:hypothetical protein
MFLHLFLGNEKHQLAQTLGKPYASFETMRPFWDTKARQISLPADGTIFKIVDTFAKTCRLDAFLG